MPESSGRVVCVVGPTASGKSELADLLALRLGSAVVSVDAMQVYRGMNIGTAKVPCSERQAPLLMVDVCAPDDEYSVELFQRDARACVDGILANASVPVLCGGTGLYLDAVIDEMTFPSRSDNDDARGSYEALASEKGPGHLHSLLASRDPESAAIIHPNNVRRVIRALELADSGNSYARHHEGLLSRSPHYDALVYALTMPREQLCERIDRRVDLMFEHGLLEEVKSLVAEGHTFSKSARQAIGYAECLAVLDGSMCVEDAMSSTKARTRRYAKRQLSWIKRDGRAYPLDMSTLNVSQAADRVLEKTMEGIS